MVCFDCKTLLTEEHLVDTLEELEDIFSPADDGHIQRRHIIYVYKCPKCEKEYELNYQES